MLRLSLIRKEPLWLRTRLDAAIHRKLDTASQSIPKFERVAEKKVLRFRIR
jgi:hypothetical protein